MAPVAWGHVVDGILASLGAFGDRYGGVTAIGGILLVLGSFFAFVLGDMVRSYKLFARMNVGAARGRFVPIAKTLLKLAFSGNIFDKAHRDSYFARARMRVEHEIFNPKPEFAWPLAEDDDDYGKPEFAPDAPKGRAKALATYKARRRTWEKEIDAVFEDQVIHAKTAGDVNDEYSAIKRYFDTLRDPVFKVSEKKFISPIHIETGFIAPLHLLAGLLIKFNSKWNRILNSFNLDTKDYTSLKLGDISSDARQIQAFIYNCWLLWGPSISICGDECGNWKGSYISFQYGYGDENNSIEIVGQREVMIDKIKKIAPSAADGPMAVNAQVKGILQLSTLVEDRFKSANAPKALSNSWGGLQDERPILYITEKVEQNRIGGGNEAKPYEGEILSVPPDNCSKYYSAYLWVIFVITRADGTLLTRAHEHESDPNGRTTAKPWLDFVPFFEHGNIADKETLAFLKAQLAEKAVAGITRLVARHGDGPFPLKFSYACAIDDSGCGHDPLFPTMNGGDRIIDLIKARLGVENAAKYLKMPQARDPAHERLVKEAIIDFDAYGAGEHDHPHASCVLPTHIMRHYGKMQADAAREAAES